MDINSTLTETVESIANNNNLLSFTISYTWLAIILGTVILYSIYYYHFREAEFIIKPQYDVNKKKMGKPLPPYPNGWYVATHSKDLKKG